MTEIPLFPLNVVLFPGGPLPLRIFETRYLDMVRRSLRENSGFGVVLIRSGSEVGPAVSYDTGTVARIVDFHQLPGGLLGLRCVGAERFKILERRCQPDGLNVGGVEWIPDEPATPVPERFAHLADLVRYVLPQLGEVYTGLEMRLDDAVWVGNRLAEILPIDPAEKLACLALRDPLARLESLAPRVQVSRTDTTGSRAN